MKTPLSLALAFMLLPLFSGSAPAADSDSSAVGGGAAAGAVLGAMRGLAQTAGPRAQAAAAAEAAQAARGVDLKAQFADPSDRDQGAVGSCHAFGSVAVIEAAYFRRYGRHIRLSEEDLFLQRTVLSGDVYDQFCSNGKCELSEGNDPAVDIRYALEHGVLSGTAYQHFVTRYLSYRAAEQRTLQGIQRMRDEQGWLERLLYDPREHWKELQTNALSKRLLSNYLEGRDRNSDAERARVKNELSGLTLKTKSFAFIGGSDAAKLTSAQCREKGLAQRHALSAEMNAGRPVAISMSLSGLPAWGQTDASKHANHAFMLLGYSDAGGKRTFHSRNSWGGQNPDVPEDQLCRVYGIDSVLGPGENSSL